MGRTLNEKIEQLTPHQKTLVETYAAQLILEEASSNKEAVEKLKKLAECPCLAEAIKKATKQVFL